MKYYKDTAGNVYAYNDIQTPKPGLIQMTPEEVEAHLNPPEPKMTLEEARQATLDAATDKRWAVMTGGVTLPSGVVVGTTIDDQNRITSVVANAALAGLQDTDEVDFKAASGWVRITIGDIKSIAGVIGQFVQDCYTAERIHHDAIGELPDDRAVIEVYDVTTGWPSGGEA
jgi:hypothetical protein